MVGDYFYDSELSCQIESHRQRPTADIGEGRALKKKLSAVPGDRFRTSPPVKRGNEINRKTFRESNVDCVNAIGFRISCVTNKRKVQWVVESV